MTMEVGKWYIGSYSGISYEPQVVVPIARQVNGAFRAIFYEFDRRIARLGSTSMLNLVVFQETSPESLHVPLARAKWTERATAREVAKCVSRIRAKLGVLECL